jgi:hypothetical protein
MESLSSSETSVNIDQTTRYNIAEDTHIHTRRHENLRFQETRVTDIEGETLCKQKERLLYLPNEKHNYILPFLFT